MILATRPYTWVAFPSALYWESEKN